MKKPEDMGPGWVLAVIAAVVIVVGYPVVRHALSVRRRNRNNSLKSSCISNLRQIHSGKEQWAIEYGGTNGQVIGWVEVGEYIRGGATKVFCPSASMKNPTNNYEVHAIGTDPKCKVVPSGRYGHIL